MSTTTEALREAADWHKKWAKRLDEIDGFDDKAIQHRRFEEACRAALAACQPAPAGEPEVVAYRHWYEYGQPHWVYTEEKYEHSQDELITLSAHREAMATMQAVYSRRGKSHLPEIMGWHNTIATLRDTIKVLVEAAQNAISYGEYEQGSGALHDLHAAIKRGEGALE